MQIRSFRGSGEPVWVNALSSARLRLGPDPRRALGPAAIPAAPTGRTRNRTRPMLQNVRKFLPGRRPHVTRSGHPLVRQSARCAYARWGYRAAGLPMGKRSDFARREADFYVTPRAAVGGPCRGASASSASPVKIWASARFLMRTPRQSGRELDQARGRSRRPAGGR